MNEIKISIPENWHDITLGQYNNMLRLFDEGLSDSENILELIRIFNPDIPEDTLNQIFVSELDTISEHFEFMTTTPPNEVIREFKILDETFVYHRELNKLTVGEMVSYETLVDSKKYDKYDHNSIVLAIILKKLIDGKPEDFNADELLNRKKLFEDNLSIGQVYSLVFFFTTTENYCMRNIQDCLKEAEELRIQMIDLLTRNRMSIPLKLTIPVLDTNGNGTVS